MEARRPRLQPITVVVLALVVAVGAAAAVWFTRADSSQELPTGPRLAGSTWLWSVSDDAGRSSIYVWPQDAPASIIVTATDSTLSRPVILPGGRTILYSSRPTGQTSSHTGFSLRAVGTDGQRDSEFRLRTSGGGLPGTSAKPDQCPNPDQPAVSRDGLIAVTCFDGEGDRLPGILVFDEKGRLVQTLDKTGVDGGPAWTPDGAYLVYWQTTKPEGERGDLYAVATDGSSAPVQLTTSGNDTFPSVSPDGSTVAYVERQNADTWTLQTIPLGPAPRAAPAGSEVDVFSFDHAVVTAWTADGRIAFLDQGQVWTVSARPDSSPTPVPDLSYPDAATATGLSVSGG